MKKVKTIQIGDELHKRIKSFCDIHKLKLNGWIEWQLLRIMSDKEKEEQDFPILLDKFFK